MMWKPRVELDVHIAKVLLMDALRVAHLEKSALLARRRTYWRLWMRMGLYHALAATISWQIVSHAVADQLVEIKYLTCAFETS